MQFDFFSFTNVLWFEHPVTVTNGAAGTASTRAVKTGHVCVRMVEFSPGYSADHWCAKGHVVLVLDGSLTTDLKDGRSFTTTAGNSFQVGDGDGQHRASTEIGARVFIVD